MPQLTAPEDLRALALPMWAALLPDWDVEMVWGDPAQRGALAFVPLDKLIPARRRATVEVWPHPPNEDLAETLAHEFTHIGWSPITEFLGRTPTAIALEEPIAERFGRALASRALSGPLRAGLARAARTLPARIRELLTPTRLAREGEPVDDIALILAALRAALTSADVGAAVTALVDEIAGMLPADAAAIEEPIAGETAPMMMRRAVTKALARKAVQVVDLLGPKVLARLGAKTDAEALMKIAALQIADTQVENLAAVDDSNERKAAVVDTMKRTGLTRAAFYRDSVDDLLDEWKGGTVDELKRTLSTLKRGGSPLARPRVEPVVANDGDEISPEVAAYAKARGIKDPKRIAALARLSGNAPQEQSR